MPDKTYSIVVPTYNEEKDIDKLLLSIKRAKLDNLEFIFVDDSSDQTASIIENFQRTDNRVRLIKPKERKGRCEARNLGIMQSKNDIVITLNADVLISDEFIEKIDKHYKNGAEALIVKSEVHNLDSAYARYVEAVNIIDYYDNPSIELDWSEGFSCVKTHALKAGLFPTGYPVKICAGEDAVFGSNLKKIGTKIVRDYSIVVQHFAPDNLKEFWKIRKGRGEGSPQIKYFILGKSLTRVWFEILIKSIFALLRIVTFVPIMSRSLALSYSEVGRKFDFIKFFYVELIVQFTFVQGSISEAIKITKLMKKKDDYQ
jgi:glycosyltransferase involved in cell wall biosynthesis